MITFFHSPMLALNSFTGDYRPIYMCYVTSQTPLRGCCAGALQGIRVSTWAVGATPAAFRASRVYPFSLSLSKTFLGCLKAHPPSSFMSHLRVPPWGETTCVPGCGPQRGGAAPGSGEEELPGRQRKPKGCVLLSLLGRHSHHVPAAEANLLAPNLVLGCERLSTRRRHRGTQLVVLTQAPGRTASIPGEY